MASRARAQAAAGKRKPTPIVAFGESSDEGETEKVPLIVNSGPRPTLGAGGYGERPKRDERKENVGGGAKESRPRTQSGESMSGDDVGEPNPVESRYWEKDSAQPFSRSRRRANRSRTSLDAAGQREDSTGIGFRGRRQANEDVDTSMGDEKMRSSIGKSSEDDPDAMRSVQSHAFSSLIPNFSFKFTNCSPCLFSANYVVRLVCFFLSYLVCLLLPSNLICSSSGFALSKPLHSYPL